MTTDRTHYYGDSCPGGHWRSNGTGCVHRSWTCEHCHDDPPPYHICPRCGRAGDRVVEHHQCGAQREESTR